MPHRIAHHGTRNHALLISAPATAHIPRDGRHPTWRRRSALPATSGRAASGRPGWQGIRGRMEGLGRRRRARPHTTHAWKRGSRSPRSKASTCGSPGATRAERVFRLLVQRFNSRRTTLGAGASRGKPRNQEHHGTCQPAGVNARGPGLPPPAPMPGGTCYAPPPRCPVGRDRDETEWLYGTRPFPRCQGKILLCPSAWA